MLFLAAAVAVINEQRALQTVGSEALSGDRIQDFAAVAGELYIVEDIRIVSKVAK